MGTEELFQPGINERIKKIRKTLGMSQAEFGQRLGLSRDVVANFERSRTTFQQIHYKLICSEFNVNPIWLLDGGPETEMFVDKDQAVKATFEMAMKSLDNDRHSQLRKALFYLVASLTDDELDVVDAIVDRYTKMANDVDGE